MKSLMINQTVGVEWTQNAGTKPDSIIDYEKYNGRINILDDSNPEARFQMAERIAIKNRSTEYRCAVSAELEDSVLSRAYFSEENVQILQNGLRAGVYEKSNKEIVIPPQNIDNLKIIMRSMYLTYVNHTNKPKEITAEIERLNKYVLDYAIKSVYNEAQGYLNYIRDVSTLAEPMKLPQQSDRDFKSLEFKSFM
jgi:hypothetical protein